MPDSAPQITAGPDVQPGPVPHRPLLILGGYRAPSGTPKVLRRRLVRYAELDQARVHLIAYPLASDLHRIARRVRREAHQRFPGPDPRATQPLDVVAISMGGLVARLSAAPAPPGEPRLRIHRLYTLATPHRGAEIARYLHPDRAARAMKPGSDTLCALDAELEHADYQLHCYAHRNDRWVGAARCAPPGREARLLLGPPIFSHFTIALNDRLARLIAASLVEDQPGAVSPAVLH